MPTNNSEVARITLGTRINLLMLAIAANEAFHEKSSNLMAFNPGKLQALSEKLQGTFAHVEQRVNSLDARLDTIPAKVDRAVDGQHAMLDTVEKHVASIEDFANQLTNGGPDGPLPVSPAMPAFVPPATLGEVPVIPPPLLSGTR